MSTVMVDERGLESAITKLTRLYPRGYLVLHGADSRRFISRQERDRMRRKRAEKRRERKAKGA